MAARPILELIAPLLALLVTRAPAAAVIPPEVAAREARAAIDRAAYDRADQIIENTLFRFGSRNDEAVWWLRVMRGEVLMTRGKVDEARKVFVEPIPQALRTSAPAVQRLAFLAFLSKKADAKRILGEAQAIARVHQPRMLSEVYLSRAFMNSDETDAREALSQALISKDRRNEARAMAALQYLLADNGSLVESISWGKKALPLAREMGLVRTAGLIEGQFGWCYAELGDYESAQEKFTLAESTAAKTGIRTEQAPWLNQLGNLQFYQRDWSAAERYYRSVLEKGESREVPKALANLAVVAIETGHLDDARRYNVEAYTRKKKAKDQESMLRSRIIDARIATAGREFARARTILEEVIEHAEHATTRWEAHGRLAEVFVGANRPRDADHEFQLAIKTVREAREVIKDRELRLSFYNTTAEIFSEYIDFLVGQQRIYAALAATEAIRVDALDDALNAHSSSRLKDPRAIAAQQNATIFSYWLGPRQSYLWIVTPTSVAAARLAPESKIAAAVQSYRSTLTGPRGSFVFSSTEGQRLYAMVGSPSGSRALVVPDGALHALNFETLVIPSTRPHYWIEDAVISEASSISVLSRPRATQDHPPTMLLIGNAPPPDSSFPPLKYAADEMNDVKRHFASRAKVLDGVSATPSAYRGASPGTFDYVHFVAHGEATRKHPLESSVILGRDATNNYRLLARDVVTQRLKAQLVTISSCHGAGTRTYTGEGLVGLAWAFLRAGASNVIAALWEVNDSATPRLMNEFYKKAAAGGDPATALRDAKLSLLRSNTVHANAHYWAPFVFYSG